eukprot:scaffold272171_cov31-Tisochrysis_lutea.AAC.1
MRVSHSSPTGCVLIASICVARRLGTALRYILLDINSNSLESTTHLTRRHLPSISVSAVFGSNFTLGEESRIAMPTPLAGSEVQAGACTICHPRALAVMQVRWCLPSV